MASRRKVLAAAVLAALLLFPEPALAGEDSPYPVWWSPSLELESLDDIDERLQRKLWPEGHGIDVYKEEYDTREEKIVDTCLSAIHLRQQGYYGKGNNNHKLLLYHLAKCRAIEMLKKARPAKRSYVRDFMLDHNSVDYLPAMVEVGPGCDWLCRQHMANEKRIPWSQFVEVVSVDVRSAVDMKVSTGPFGTRVKNLGRADFSGDGLEDLLIWADAWATEGTWGATEIYVLSRDRPGSVLWVADADTYLCREYRCQSHYDYPEALR